MVDVIVDQSLLRIKDRTFDSLQLLRNLQTWPAFLDHIDDCPQMAVGTLQPSNYLGMAMVHHHFFLIPLGGLIESSLEDNNNFLDFESYESYLHYDVQTIA